MMTATPGMAFVDVRCLYRGCPARAQMAVTPGPSGTNFNPPPGWVFYRLGFPQISENLGVCQQHQHVVLGGKRNTEVTVTGRTHGVYYEVRENGVNIGDVTFPTNTLIMQPTPGAIHPRLIFAGRRVATLFGFSPDNRIVDDLMAPIANPIIKSGGPNGYAGGTWLCEVEYGSPEGGRETVLLSRAQLADWSSRT